jgi:hypothetical protein
MDSILTKAAQNVGDIVRLALKPSPASKTLVIFDDLTPLSRTITEAYRLALPRATFLDFSPAGAEAVWRTVDALSPGDLVVLVQSNNFRLNEFRFRIELFKRGLWTIDHMHLERAKDDEQMATYVDALAYDPSYYLGLGRALKEKIDGAQTTVVRCTGTILTYGGGMEPSKLNIGDYTGMKNVGGTFPIGEVFSEPKDLSRVNGEALIFAFAGLDHLVQTHAPFKVAIKDGILTAPDAPSEFQAVIEQISAEEKVMVREFGLGLNPAMGKHRLLSDITAFERQKGLHLSLGEKHPIYKKPGLRADKTHFHVDVFVEVERIEINGGTIYSDGDFLPDTFSFRTK